MYQAWKKDDAPPTRVKPLPISLISQVWTLTAAESTPVASAAAQCLVHAFFFLLRPGEYLGVPRTEHGSLFRIRDVQLWIALVRCPPSLARLLTSWRPPL